MKFDLLQKSINGLSDYFSTIQCIRDKGGWGRMTIDKSTHISTPKHFLRYS